MPIKTSSASVHLISSILIRSLLYLPLICSSSSLSPPSWSLYSSAHYSPPFALLSTPYHLLFSVSLLIPHPFFPLPLLSLLIYPSLPSLFSHFSFALLTSALLSTSSCTSLPQFSFAVLYLTLLPSFVLYLFTLALTLSSLLLFSFNLLSSLPHSPYSHYRPLLNRSSPLIVFTLPPLPFSLIFHLSFTILYLSPSYSQPTLIFYLSALLMDYSFLLTHSLPLLHIDSPF